MANAPLSERKKNMLALEGVWIPVLQVREYNSDETARQMIREKIHCMVPLKDIKDLF